MSLFTFVLQSWEIDDEYISRGMPSIKLSPWNRAVIGKKENVKSFVIFFYKLYVHQHSWSNKFKSSMANYHCVIKNCSRWLCIMGAQRRALKLVKFHYERTSKTSFEMDHHGIKFKHEFARRCKCKVISKFVGK